MNRCNPLYCFLLTLILVASGPDFAGADTYYVSPDGSDQSPGTADQPWATMAHAGTHIGTGDTLRLMPGTYGGRLDIDRSGTEATPIVVQAEKRRTVTLIGDATGDPVIDLSGRSYVHLEGLHVHPMIGEGADSPALIQVSDADHIVIRDCKLEGTNKFGAVHIDNSSQVRVRANHFRGVRGNLLHVTESSHVLIAGNAFQEVGHAPLRIRLTQNAIVRGNVFHNGWGRNFGISDETRNIVVENNIITNAYSGGRSATGSSKFYVNRGIFRFNQVYRNWEGPLVGRPYRDTHHFRDVRVYHNTFHDNAAWVWEFRTSHSNVKHSLFVNNIFAENDPWGSHTQISFTGGEATADQVQFHRNIIVGDHPGRRQTIHDNGITFSAVEAQNNDPRFHDNMDVEPGFIDAAGYNHRLRSDSRAIDAGRFLTRTTSSGEGHKIPVEDAQFFSDGLGIVGQRGDLIAIGEEKIVRRISAVDQDSETITVDRPTDWDSAAAISFPWSGSHPDIGGYERGGSEERRIRIDGNSFRLQPNESTAFQIEKEAGRFRSIRWYLGDGTVQTGSSITHAYTEPGDYGIRVIGVDRDGYRHYGTAYVVVRENRKGADPLVQLTFGLRNPEWWWKVNVEPDSGHFEPRLDLGFDGHITMRAPEKGASMPVQIRPKEWMIDRHPTIEFRYRVAKGTPVAVWVEGYRLVDRPVYYLAGTARSGRGDVGLTDDGKLHTIRLDVRSIRNEFPEIQAIKELRFGVPDNAPSSEAGDQYSLDRVIIWSDSGEE